MVAAGRCGAGEEVSRGEPVAGEARRGGQDDVSYFDFFCFLMKFVFDLELFCLFLHTKFFYPIFFCFGCKKFLSSFCFGCKNFLFKLF